MDTSQIKKFAIAARKVLLQGVVNKLSTLGFDPQGRVTLSQMPVLAHNDTNFNGRIILGTSFFHQWNALNQAIQQKGVQPVYEEVAYTWFNRLVAIRILQNQDARLIPNVLDFVDDSNTPAIVNDARHGIVPPGMDQSTLAELNRLLGDDTKTTEQFAILISAFCESTPILRKVFGRIDDYTELLLPTDILAKNGFVDMLNNTEFITADDYKKTELIGWLYQFYISERKDEVFELDEWSSADIPAGTQIFTPNWIVKYMVENTLGRIYLDNNPDSSLGEGMKYLVAKSEGEHPVYHFENIEDLRCADFSCGSGHVLGEFFDMLYRIYTEEKWYDSRAAIVSILQNNIVGVDLDTRAQQLSAFTLLLKACQKDESFIDAQVMPRVLDMPSIAFVDSLPIVNRLFKNYSAKIQEEVHDAFELIENANELGSIMKFKLSEKTREAIQKVWSNYGEIEDVNNEFSKSLELMLILTDRYSAVCMNPPYMGAKHMDAALKNYVKKQYVKSKADLFAVFMDLAINKLQDDGKYGMINMHSWMFLPSFEKLRAQLLERYSIESLIHLGARLFDEIGGEVVQSVAFIVAKRQPDSQTANYFRLLNGRNCKEKEKMFLSNLYCYVNIKQEDFTRIDGTPIGYWLSEHTFELFEGKKIADYGYAGIGMRTGDNERFLRLWHEVSVEKFSQISRVSLKWYPYNKGGEFRKWYGNNDYVVNWENDGFEIKENTKLHYPELGDNLGWKISNEQYYFLPGITWTGVTTGKFNCRVYPEGYIFDSGANGLFANAKVSREVLAAYLNSAVANLFLELLNPTINYGCGTVRKVPFVLPTSEVLHNLANRCISISKQDWDSHESSWDFEENELIRIFKQNGGVLEEIISRFIDKWNGLFNELKINEEQINSQFIELYGLNNELTSDIKSEEVTILQQKEISIVNEQVIWDKSVLLKQLLSYAMGCWMGRYRLDRPGLHIAHPNPSKDELANYTYNGQSFAIDEDGIIPMMDEDCPFPDNAARRMKEFVGQVFGRETLATNLNYINATLGRNMTLEKFFKNEFWKDHVARYQKRPIYWLFQSSRRNPAFQVLVYMHRMDAYTCEKVRSYLLLYIEYLNTRITYLENQIATPVITRELTQKKEALKECYEYELRLHDIANRQIAFDLDDGVKVNYAKFGDVLAPL